MAPVFDSGSSLGYDKVASRSHAERDIICKPFKKHHAEQLKLVSSFDWINFEALSGVGDMIREVFSEKQARDFVSADRCEAVIASVEERIRTLQKIAQSEPADDKHDNIHDDVEEDTAEDYSSK